MLILALDSSATVASVCLAEDEKILSLFNIGSIKSHSEILLPMIKNSLQKAKKTIDDIDLFACASGPGSFTGLRIGISTIKGLAFGKGKPCVGVSTLASLSVPFENEVFKDKIVCPVMDARRGCFFNALFSGGERLCPDRYISSQELEEELKEIGKPVLFTGDGYELALNSINYDKIEHTPTPMRYSCAANIATLAAKTYKSDPDGNYSDASLAPFYLRPSQAEKTLMGEN